MDLWMGITYTHAYHGSTYPIFLLVEVNNLMDWRRRNDILDSKILSSFNTSSLLRLVEESVGDMFSAALLPSLVYRRKSRNHVTELTI